MPKLTCHRVLRPNFKPPFGTAASESFSEGGDGGSRAKHSTPRRSCLRSGGARGVAIATAKFVSIGDNFSDPLLANLRELANSVAIKNILWVRHQNE